MSEQKRLETTQYTLKELSGAELKTLIDGFRGSSDEDYAFLVALMDEYALRPESPQVDVKNAKQRCMDALGLSEQNKKARRVSRPLHMAIAAAAAVFVLAGGVMAIGLHSDFFRNIFGFRSNLEDNLTAESSTYTYTDNKSGDTISYSLPGYQLVEVDEGKANRLLGAYVQELNESYTFGEYTLTILGYIEDELGSYRLYYCLENPNGLDNIELYEYNGRRCLDYQADADLRVQIGGTWSFVDSERSTENRVYVCVPGVVVPYLDNGVKLEIFSNAVIINTIRIAPKTTVPATVLEDEDYRVSLSPMGAKVFSLHQQEGIGFSLSELVIHLSTGEEFTVYQKDITDNTVYTSSGGDVEDSQTFCFNRLIDPDTVSSLVIDGKTVSVEKP